MTKQHKESFLSNLLASIVLGGGCGVVQFILTYVLTPILFYLTGIVILIFLITVILISIHIFRNAPIYQRILLTLSAVGATLLSNICLTILIFE